LIIWEFLGLLGLASARTSDPGASVRTLPAQGASERTSSGPASPLNVVRTASHFPRASHMQHLILLLKHTNATYKPRQMKHLKQASKTLAKMPKEHLKPLQTYAWNSCKHTYETSENTWNVCLQHARICNIQIKHLQYSSGIDETVRHYNMCNILIYFFNIRMKLLKHTSETTKTLET
jgi:hypothetical protein